MHKIKSHKVSHPKENISKIRLKNINIDNKPISKNDNIYVVKTLNLDADTYIKKQKAKIIKDGVIEITINKNKIPNKVNEILYIDVYKKEKNKKDELIDQRKIWLLSDDEYKKEFKIKQNEKSLTSNSKKSKIGIISLTVLIPIITLYYLYFIYF